MSAISHNQNVRGWQKNHNGATFSCVPWRVQTQCEPDTTLIISESDRICTHVTLQPALSLQTAVPSQKTPPTMCLPLSESYIRQGDFVAIYSEQSPMTFGYQVYFCLKPTTEDLLVIELWLSVQTSTLESHPQLRLCFDASSNCDAGSNGDAGPNLEQPSRFAEIAPGQIQSEDLTRGVIVHPLDIADCTWVPHSNTNSLSPGNSRKPELLAFGGFMEKGVIRRMRLQLVHSRQKIDANRWQQLVESFSNSPLPLTA